MLQGAAQARPAISCWWDMLVGMPGWLQQHNRERAGQQTALQRFQNRVSPCWRGGWSELCKCAWQVNQGSTRSPELRCCRLGRWGLCPCVCGCVRGGGGGGGGAPLGIPRSAASEEVLRPSSGRRVGIQQQSTSMGLRTCVVGGSRTVQPASDSWHRSSCPWKQRLSAQGHNQQGVLRFCPFSKLTGLTLPTCTRFEEEVGAWLGIGSAGCWRHRHVSSHVWLRGQLGGHSPPRLAVSF